MGKISIIIPVFNEIDNIADCYVDLKANVLDKLDDYELIFVDDGSEDSTYEECKKVACVDVNVRVLKLSRNFGSLAACYAGFTACVGDCCVVKSADMQEPSSLILDMYYSWKQGNRVVLAAREDREEGLSQKFFANFYYWLVRRFISMKMPEQGFDIYLLDRKVIEAIKLLDERNSSIVLQILWSGFKTDIVKYTRLARERGASKWTLSRKLRLVFDSFMNFSTVPVRIIEIVGLLFSSVAVVWAIALIVARLTTGDAPQGFTAMMVLLLFSLGLIMLILGILGEYLWRILDVAQNRPVCFIEEEFDGINVELPKEQGEALN